MNSAPNRYRFRYSLRTLMLVVLLVSMAMSLFVLDRKRVREIEELKRKVQVEHRAFEAVATEAERTIHRLGGYFYRDCRTVDGLYANLPHLTDADLECLAKFPEIKGLNFGGTQITDAGLGHLTELTNLRQMVICDTKVTEEGAKRLQQALPNCEIIRY